MHRFALILLAALALPACGGQPQYIALQQTVDGLTVTLERPQEVVALQDHDVFVTLADAEGRPVDGATIYLDQSMPGMVMGVNQPLAEGLGGGRYRVATVYSMEGDWLVVVHARVGGKEYVAGFDYPVMLPKP
jgi:hypothetical protein